MNYLFFIIVIAVVIAVLWIASFTNFELDDAHYDRLKWVVLKWGYIVAFIGVIVKAFNMPYGVETVPIVGAIGALLGGLLDVSTKEYNKPLEMDVTGLQYLEDGDIEDGDDDEQNELPTD